MLFSVNIWAEIPAGNEIQNLTRTEFQSITNCNNACYNEFTNKMLRIYWSKLIN